MCPPHGLRQTLYDGHLVVLTRLRALNDFVDYTREELTELFSPHDPEHVHEHIDPAEMAKMLGVWKPRFIHSERSRKLVRAIIKEAGFSAEETHYDLPKPRTSFPVGHLTTGVAYRLPLASGHLVQRAGPADQLVAAHLPGPRRQRHGLRPGQFRPGGPEHLGHLRLLPEQRRPAHHGDRE